MSLNAQDRLYHEQYEHLDDTTRTAVDNAFDVVVEQLRLQGLFCANDDRAERLIAMITRYVKESNENEKTDI